MDFGLFTATLLAPIWFGSLELPSRIDAKFDHPPKNIKYCEMDRVGPESRFIGKVGLFKLQYRNEPADDRKILLIVSGTHRPDSYFFKCKKSIIGTLERSNQIPQAMDEFLSELLRVYDVEVPNEAMAAIRKKFPKIEVDHPRDQDSHEFRDLPADQIMDP